MSALKRVPDELSFHADIVDAWKPISKHILEKEFSPSLWSDVNHSLELGWEKFKKGELMLEYDWEFDLAAAQNLHRSNVEWAEGMYRHLLYVGNMWQQNADSMKSFARELSIAGIKFAFIAHGAVGVGCLGFIGSNNKVTYTYYTAVGCIAGAVIGIGLVALGGIVLVNSAAASAQHIRSRLSRQMTLKKSRMLSRVWDKKISPQMSLAENLMFGSIFWLIFYISVAVVALINA
jgi:hypothetical protein